MQGIAAKMQTIAARCAKKDATMQAVNAEAPRAKGGKGRAMARKPAKKNAKGAKKKSIGVFSVGGVLCRSVCANAFLRFCIFLASILA